MSATPTSSTTPPQGVPYAPPPWTCQCRMFWIPISLPSSGLPADIYAPLEASVLIKDGVKDKLYPPGMLQVVRYSDTPVGPYDELVIVPGLFKPPEGKDPNLKGKFLRVARIYVNGRETNWNGRRGFNMAKHLAAFSIDETSTNLSVKVYPPTSENDPTRKPGSIPFFSAQLSKIPYLPSFPLSSYSLSWFGMGDTLLQPPLPEGSESPLLCGTEYWKTVKLEYKALKGARLCWVKLGKTVDKDKAGHEEIETDALLSSKEEMLSDPEGWIPDLSKYAWKIGVWLGETKFELCQVTDWPKL